jgi:hypothetical protein
MKTFAAGLLIVCLAAAALVSAPAPAQERPASAGPVNPQLMEDLIAANIGWNALAGDLLAEIEAAWPHSMTFRGPDGQSISEEQALQGRRQ